MPAAASQCGAQRQPGRTCVMIALLVLLVCAHASGSLENGTYHDNSLKAAKKLDLPPGCLYDGRWHVDGAAVRTREACLLCACARGALSCRRQACAPLPEPPPRCHVLHRKGECCPELHCPDGVRYLSQAASSRVDDDNAPVSSAHACVEGGTVYAAGSAMSSNTACEQCFCLGGARRCVRPRCLPTPDGCRPRPAPGACCPQRYYCQHVSTKPPSDINSHDCKTQEGTWVPEGERVSLRGGETKCAHCFCLRGSIRCQNLSCAPTLQGCVPLVQPGQCCPHQYQCGNRTNGSLVTNLHNGKENVIPSINENRSFHKSKSTKRETTIKNLSTVTDKSTSTLSTTKKAPTSITKTETQATKTLATSTTSNYSASTQRTTIKIINSTNTQLRIEEVTTKITPTTKSEVSTTTEETTEKYNTEQPEKTVKIIINGTINCTTELSSATLLLNTTNNTDSDWKQHSLKESQPRIPLVDTDVEAHTYSPNDIITNRNPIDGFDGEDEVFTINVTSSLRTNTTINATLTTSTTTSRPKTSAPIIDTANISKPKKEELDYDYTEPTLPPSLPNLKIIPFVAADAVVDDDILPKDNHQYSMLEREDKFPVYYPSIDLDTKDTSYETRKEDTYPTQYPIFVSKNVATSKYSAISAEKDTPNVAYPSLTNDLLTSVHEYTVTTSLGGVGGSHKPEVKLPNDGEDNDARTPAVNLFSPPIKTEGGFLPKSPGVADEFYSMYPSTPPGPAVPHLTTSMQLEPKDECISSDGQRVDESGSINVGCSICTCAWGELHCSPRPCSAPPGCQWRAASIHALDLCCGELICDYSNKTTTHPTTTTRLSDVSSSETNQWGNTAVPNIKNLTQFHGIGSYNINNTMDNVADQVKYALNENETEADVTTLPPFKPFVNYKDTTTSQSSNSSSVIEENGNGSHSVEYDDEDDDEGFSLGSVLKLLLSESYDTKKPTTTIAPPKNLLTTTVAPTKKTKPEQHQIKQTTSAPINVAKTKPFDTEPNKFIPMPSSFSYSIPSKNKQPQDTINRIDHLLLGESTAIKETTPRPPPTRLPAKLTTRKPFTSKPSHRPYTTKIDKFIDKEISTEINNNRIETSPPILNNYPSNNGFGLPKLAGCNIYGQMYRVGRIIAELSTPCQECRCTDIGVQCKSLSC